MVAKYYTQLLFIHLACFLLIQADEDLDQTEFYQKYIPSLNFAVKSGYIDIEEYEGSMFYQLIYRDGTNPLIFDESDPLIIWLQGGPGCGSQFALYDEFGPFIVANDTEKDDFKITLRDKSWNKHSHLLFIDQPLRSGLSYQNQEEKKITNTTESARVLVEFMAKFYETNSDFVSSPLYIFGESYAGHYIPAFANQLLQDERFKDLNYKGVGIGDGLTDAAYQFTYQMQYLYQLGMLDQESYNKGLKYQVQIQQLISRGELSEASDMIDELIALGANFAGIKPTNFKQKQEKNEFESPYTIMFDKYRDQFKIPEKVHDEGCSDKIYEEFKADITLSFAEDLLWLLNKGEVLIYNGQLDYLVNSAGQQQWLISQNNEILQGWQKSQKKSLKLDDKVVGTYKRYQKFTYVTIYQAGHMVPTDQPEAADLMVRMMLNNWDY